MNKSKLLELTDTLLGYHREISEFYSEYAKSAGLTYSGFIILGIIWKEKNVNQKSIMKKSCFPKQTVNTIIKGFITQGILELTPDKENDKRQKIIKLTPNGQKYADKIMLKAQEAEFRAFDIVGEDRAKLLIDIIKTYKENLKIE